jgi:phage shock protein C
MEGTPTGSADRRSAARPTETQQDSPPTPTPERPAPTGGGGLAESRAWLSGQGLMRPRQGRMIAGVCAGLARRFGMPVFLVRVLMVAAGFAGVGVVGYLALWVLMPKED